MNERAKKDRVVSILWLVVAGGVVSFILSAIVNALYDDPRSILHRIQNLLGYIHLLCFLAACPLAVVSSYKGFVRRKVSNVVLSMMGPLLVFLLFYISATGLYESKTYKRWGQAREKMRNIDIALRDYSIDNGRLPESLSLLPDTVDLLDIYSPEGNSFRWRLLDNDNGELISVGPDGVLNDEPDGTRILYDPTNGFLSFGDVVRSVICK